jgi:hypothetical protein
MGIVANGHRRARRAKEREIRQQLLQRYRSELESSGLIQKALLRAKIYRDAYSAARRALPKPSRRDFHLKV